MSYILKKNQILFMESVLVLAVLQKSLDEYHTRAVDEQSEGVYQVVAQMCQRKLMQKAEYFCAGMYDDAEMYRHFALNVPVYTHFTSPLRKYADLTVHRQLLTAIGLFY